MTAVMGAAGFSDRMPIMTRVTRSFQLFICLVIAIVTRPGLAGASDSCVACHRHVTGVGYLEHDFTDWSKSIHAVSGVSCRACHGGDPSKDSKEAAHAGLKVSSDPASKVYYTRIPETCGSCHTAVLAAFKTSKHYHELQATGKGPNCATCHGSMANHILEPRLMQMTCTLCHRNPSGAHATLLALNNAGGRLRQLRKDLDAAGGAGTEVNAQRATWRDQQKKYDEARIAWHTFKMERVLAMAQEITHAVTTAQNEIKVKSMQKSGGDHGTVR